MNSRNFRTAHQAVRSAAVHRRNLIEREQRTEGFSPRASALAKCTARLATASAAAIIIITSVPPVLALVVTDQRGIVGSADLGASWRTLVTK